MFLFPVSLYISLFYGFLIMLNLWPFIYLHLLFLQCWCVQRASPWTAGAWRRWWRGTLRTSSFSYSRSSGRPERWECTGQRTYCPHACFLHTCLITLYASLWFMFRFRSSVSMSWWLLSRSCSSPHCFRYKPLPTSKCFIISSCFSHIVRHFTCVKAHSFKR